MSFCILYRSPAGNDTPPSLQFPDFSHSPIDIHSHFNHGSTEHVDAIANARHGNIYADTSARGCAFNNIVEYAVERVGSEKVLFGTDTYSCAYSYPRIALADLPMKDKENILWKNALRLFPGAFQ